MSGWLGVEERLARMPREHPARQKFLDRVNYYGQIGGLDVQGRVLIPPRLREAAAMTGDVDVLGQVDYLEVWNHERLLAKLQREPFTNEDAARLAEFGI
jgi:MraZ protein